MTCLYLHVANNDVWFGDDDTPAANTGMLPLEFINNFEKVTGYSTADVSKIYLYGIRENADLISLLYTTNIRPIYITNPIHLLKCSSPNNALILLRHQDTAIRLNHFSFPLDDLSLVTFLIISKLQHLQSYINDIPLTDQDNLCLLQDKQLTDLLFLHPAWPVLSFVPHIRILDACQLLSLIIDPRFFAHEYRPHRYSKIYKFLGLTSLHNCEKILPPVNGSNLKSFESNMSRTAIAVRCWYNSESILFYSRNHTNPESFLWRIYRSEPNHYAGLLKATRYFLRFLLTVWKCMLSSHPEAVFIPEKFFKYWQEARAFGCHLELITK